MYIILYSIEFSTHLVLLRKKNSSWYDIWLVLSLAVGFCTTSQKLQNVLCHLSVHIWDLFHKQGVYNSNFNIAPLLIVKTSGFFHFFSTPYQKSLKNNLINFGHHKTINRKLNMTYFIVTPHKKIIYL